MAIKQRSESNLLPTNPMELTDFHLKALKPRAKRYEMLVGQGLALRVAPTGIITFRYIYRFDGKQRAATVGQYPGKKLDMLRVQYLTMMGAVSMGVDPAAETRAARESKQVAQATVAKQKVGLKASALADMFLAHINDDRNHSSKGRPWAKSTRTGYAKSLNKYFVPTFGKLRVVDLSAEDIAVWLKGVAYEQPSQSNYILCTLRVMFKWACAPAQGYMKTNPAAAVSQQGAETAKDRALDYNAELDEVIGTDEIRGFWYGMDDINPLHKLALQMILLTGQRPGEVYAAEWAHIVGDKWILPSTTTKNRKVHKIPLTTTLKRHLKAIKTLSGHTPYLFPKSRFDSGELTIRGDGHISHSAGSKTTLTLFPDIPAFTPHDLRRTVATHLKGKLEANDFEIGQLLNHTFGGVTAIYARGSDDKTTKKMLDKWHRRLDTALGADVSNVVSMR